MPATRVRSPHCPERPDSPPPRARHRVALIPNRCCCSCCSRLSTCCCPLALAHHSASGLAINICDVLVEEGGPRVEAKRRGGDPLPRCQLQSQISQSERAAACSFGGSLCTDPPNDPPQPCNPDGCPVYIRTAKRTPETSTRGAWDDSSTVSGGPRILTPAAAIQHSRWQGAEGCAGGCSVSTSLAGL
jgi:hypothetical protein